jgi:hypothetical protein
LPARPAGENVLAGNVVRIWLFDRLRNDSVESYAPSRTPVELLNALSTGSWMLLRTAPPMTAITIAAAQAAMNVFMVLFLLEAYRLQR